MKLDHLDAVAKTEFDWVIAPSKRSALAFKRDLVAIGKPLKLPNCIDFDGFLIVLWQRLLAKHLSDLTLLNEEHMVLFWQHLFAKSEHPEIALQARRHAKEMLVSWQFFWQHQTTLVVNKASLYQRFEQSTHDAITAFIGFKSRHQLITVAELYCPVVENLAQLLSNEKIIFIDSVLARPDRALLINTLEAIGLKPSYFKSDCQAVASVSKVNKTLDGVIPWCRAQLLDNKKKLLVVDPLLSTRQHELRQLFLSNGLACNVSVGSPLTEFPLVSSALILLRSMTGHSTVSDERWRPLLSCRQLFDTDQAMWQAQLRYEEIRSREEDPQLAQLLGQAAVKRPRQKATRLYWVDFCTTALATLRYPRHSLSSEEYQQWTKFRSLLSHMGSPDAYFVALTFEEFYAELFNICQESSYQVEAPTGSNTPIQITGLYESLNLTADATLILDLDLDNFPEKVAPLRLLDAQWQSREHIGRSSRDACRNRAHAMLNNWITTCQQLDFLMSQNATFSHLLALVPLKEWPYPVVQRPVAPLLQLEDEAPTSCHTTLVSNGLSRLRDHQICPMQAHLRHRLEIAPLTEGFEGISPRDRGIMHHELLEQLLANRNQGLSHHKIIASLRQKFKHWPEPYAQVEWVIATEVADRFSADLNKADPQCSLSHELEITKTLTLGAHQIRLRIDRVDRDANERMVIIDHKSGRHASASAVLKAEEPQLPAYTLALANEGRVSNALAYCSTSAATWGSKELNFDINEQLLNEWDNHLTQVLTDHMRGDIRLTPSRSKCNVCDFTSICRVTALGACNE